MSAWPDGAAPPPGEPADPLLGELLREFAPASRLPQSGLAAGAERAPAAAPIVACRPRLSPVAALPAGRGTPGWSTDGALLAVIGGTAAAAEWSLLVRREEIARAAAVLRNRFRYTLLVDLCGADYPQRARRFEVVYHLYSFRENRRLRLKVVASESEPVPSLVGVFAGAAWLEREVYDLYGVLFTGHPRLARLLLPEGFAGHPLRKDFPLAGIAGGAAAQCAPGENDAAAGLAAASAARPASESESA